MTTTPKSSFRVCRWSAGAGLAAAAAAAVGMATAHADDGSIPADIGLLNTAEADIAEAFSLSGDTSAAPGFFTEVEAIQTPLLSSDNSLVTSFGEALFNGPDQNIAQASEAFLTAAQTFSSDPTDLTALSDYVSASFQVDGSIFRLIPSTLVGKLADQIFDIGGFDTASAGATTDVAASAAATTTPADLLSDATTNFTDAEQILVQMPTVGDASTAGLAEQLTTDLQQVAQLGVSESALSSYDSGAFAELLNPLFNSVNQGWDHASDGVLAADQRCRLLPALDRTQASTPQFTVCSALSSKPRSCRRT